MKLKAHHGLVDGPDLLYIEIAVAQTFAIENKEQ